MFIYKWRWFKKRERYLPLMPIMLFFSITVYHSELRPTHLFSLVNQYLVATSLIELWKHTMVVVQRTTDNCFWLHPGQCPFLKVGEVVGIYLWLYNPPENIRAIQSMPNFTNVNFLPPFLVLISCQSAFVLFMHDIHVPLHFPLNKNSTFN